MKALQKVLEKLLLLDDKQFSKLLKKHAHGYYAKVLRSIDEEGLTHEPSNTSDN